MNDLTKAHLRALMYFYTIMALPFALAWGLYFAGVDLPGMLVPLAGGGLYGADMAGAYADCLVLILGAVPGMFLLRGRMKANAETIKAVNDAPLSAKSFQALALSALLTGTLGFGLFLALAFTFLPYTFVDYTQHFAFETEASYVEPFAPRLASLVSDGWHFLGLGAGFGAFMWGAAQQNKAIKYGTFAAFVGFVFYTHTVQQSYAPPISAPTFIEQSADVDTGSPVLKDELQRLEGEPPAP